MAWNWRRRLKQILVISKLKWNKFPWKRTSRKSSIITTISMFRKHACYILSTLPMHSSQTKWFQSSNHIYMFLYQNKQNSLPLQITVVFIILKSFCGKLYIRIRSAHKFLAVLLCSYTPIAMKQHNTRTFKR